MGTSLPVLAGPPLDPGDPHRAGGPVLAISSVPGGYRLDADAESLDLVAFRHAVAAARTAAAPARCDLLGRALDL